MNASEKLHVTCDTHLHLLKYVEIAFKAICYGKFYWKCYRNVTESLKERSVMKSDFSKVTPQQSLTLL